MSPDADLISTNRVKEHLQGCEKPQVVVVKSFRNSSASDSNGVFNVLSEATLVSVHKESSTEKRDLNTI